jgi:hypothetical protein
VAVLEENGRVPRCSGSKATIAKTRATMIPADMPPTAEDADPRAVATAFLPVV